MKTFIGVTDKDWYDFLRTQTSLDEANFWQPSANREFKALDPGELFLFKLHSPNNYIVGGGFFAHYSKLPISLAWEAFGIRNGAHNLEEMRQRLGKYRSLVTNEKMDYEIGNILLEQPFFLTNNSWIPVPKDWKSNIVQGRTYDLSVEPGLTLWRSIQSSLTLSRMIREEPQRYGEPVLTFPRLGQGSFRILVTDAYQRRCAISNEKALPALDAAHIKPFSEEGLNEVNNGLLLRRDLHALFDSGYVTITDAMKVEVSKKLKEEFDNGKEYYKFHGLDLHLPIGKSNYPSAEYIQWHNNNIYLG